MKTRLLERREAGFNFRDEPHPAEAIPVLTFKENVTFDWNGENIDVIYLGNTSHTDGDVVIFFETQMSFTLVISMSTSTGTLSSIFQSEARPLPEEYSKFTGLRDNIAAMLSMIDDDTQVMCPATVRLRQRLNCRPTMTESRQQSTSWKSKN